MTEKEILEVVYIMLDDYQTLTNNILFDRNPSFFEYKLGFCSWLKLNILSYMQKVRIIDVLKEDLLYISNISEEQYWYEIYLHNNSFENSILPRIEHLKRTISRLEQEIINDAAAIM